MTSQNLWWEILPGYHSSTIARAQMLRQQHAAKRHQPAAISGYNVIQPVLWGDTERGVTVLLSIIGHEAYFGSIGIGRLSLRLALVHEQSCANTTVAIIYALE